LSDIPVHLKYSESHCWVELLGDDTARVGITDHAQQQLGSVIFIDLPEKGRIFSQIEECLQIESIDTTTGVYCPLTGEIIDVNFDLEENPELINIDPYGSGWLFIIRHNNRQAGKGLMNAEEYSGIIS
jgi:glycine cleavage system H protein